MKSEIRSSVSDSSNWVLTFECLQAEKKKSAVLEFDRIVCDSVRLLNLDVYG